MIKLSLSDKMREKILEYDIENSEHCYDRDMFYITYSEKEILRHIIRGWGEMVLSSVGFNQSDIELILNDEIKIDFSNEKEYYIELDNY